MNYKLLLKTLLIGFILFSLVVTLGIKYNWVKYLQPSSDVVATEARLPEPSKPMSADSSDPSNTNSSVLKTNNFELVNEENIDEAESEQVRNDCIRASRRAGVTDDNILAVVKQCVEMSLKNMTGDMIPVETSEASPAVEEEKNKLEEGLELTKKACKIIADEEQGLSAEDRQKVIEQCVKANMNTQ